MLSRRQCVNTFVLSLDGILITTLWYKLQPSRPLWLDSPSSGACGRQEVTDWLQYMMTSSNGNISRVTCPLSGEFPAQRPVTRSFDVLFDLRPNKWMKKQSWGCLFQMPSCSLWRHCNDNFQVSKHLFISMILSSVLPMQHTINHTKWPLWQLLHYMIAHLVVNFQMYP